MGSTRTMTDQLDLLKQLQEIDTELFRLRSEQRRKPQELERIDADVAAQAAMVKGADGRVTSLQLAQKEKEVELQTYEGSVSKFKGQLFQVKTNKEYTALQHEIDSLTADNSLLEEEILKLYDALEEAQRQDRTARQGLAEREERARTERARIECEVAELGETIARLERERQGLTPQVPPETLAAYGRVLENRGGLALVPMVSESCGGCNRRVTPQIANEVYLRAKLVTCESCNRILYTDEAPS